MNRVLITGASSGIGKALAVSYAEEGNDLILVARRGELLEDLARTVKDRFNRSARVLALDLAAPGAAAACADAVGSEGLRLSGLVNNAGVALRSKFVDSHLRRTLAMLQLNVVALTELTRHCLPLMLRSGGGHILNVASTAAYQPGPNMAVYYASKAYVLSFTLALREELRGTSVTAHALCPGATASEFARRSGMESSLIFRRVMDAETVAASALRGVRRNRAVIIPGRRHRVFAALAKCSPGTWGARVVGKLQ